MGKYQEASRCYLEAMNCWHKFKDNKDVTYNYSKFINMMTVLAGLDLPDPFAGKVDEPEVVEEPQAHPNDAAKEEPKAEEFKVETVAAKETTNSDTAKISFKSAEKTETKNSKEYSKYPFRHK